MKTICRVLATILTIVFIAYTFASLFLYSTIHTQKHSAYTSFVENYYNEFSEKISELIKNYTSTKKPEAINVESNEFLSLSPQEPNEELDVESIFEILKQIIANSDSSIDLSGIISGNVSKEEISKLIEENKDVVDSIIQQSCEKMNTTQENLISNILNYLNANNVDTQPLNQTNNLREILSLLFSPTNTTPSTIETNETTIPGEGGQSTTSQKLNEIKEALLSELKEIVGQEDENIAYTLVNEEAQKLLTVIRDFMTDDRFSSLIDDVIDKTLEIILNADTNSFDYTLSNIVREELNNHEESIDEAFSEALDKNDTTYPEFILIFNEVMANVIPNYRRIDVITYSTFSKVLKRAMDYYDETIDSAVNLNEINSKFHDKVPSFLIKILSFTYKYVASNRAIFFLIFVATLFLLLLCLTSWSFSYGFFCGAITFTIDGSVLLFVSSHPSLFSSILNKLPAELHAGAVLLLNSLGLSWHVTGIWALSIGAILLIISIIFRIIRR